jgi:predicted ribonuclease YlaK
MKTIITRAGTGSKVVCLGNLAIDTSYLSAPSSAWTPPDGALQRFFEHVACNITARCCSILLSTPKPI